MIGDCQRRTAVGCHGWSGAIQPQLRTRFASDQERGTKEHRTDKRTNRDVRPRRKRNPHCPRSQQHRDVRDEIVSRAHPDRPHVDVFGAMAPEQGKANTVHAKRESTHHAHCLEARELRIRKLVHQLREDECAE
jgi:hypothetical protein